MTEVAYVDHIVEWAFTNEWNPRNNSTENEEEGDENNLVVDDADLEQSDHFENDFGWEVEEVLDREDDYATKMVPCYDADMLVTKLVAKCRGVDGMFDWDAFGTQAGTCYNAMPANVSFLNGSLTVPNKASRQVLIQDEEDLDDFHTTLQPKNATIITPDSSNQEGRENKRKQNRRRHRHSKRRDNKRKGPRLSKHIENLEKKVRRCSLQTLGEPKTDQLVSQRCSLQRLGEL